MTEESYTRPYRRRFANSEINGDTLKQPNYKCTSKSPSLCQNTDSINGHGKLAQEIQDELLICKICLGNYKQPKSLSCLHTFCADCLESHIQGELTYKKYSDYRDFTCPLCRKRTTLPVGGVKKLPDNFVVASLFDMIQKRKSSISEYTDDEDIKISLTCQICQKLGHKQKEAQTKCIDCCKLLCRHCTEMHRQTKVTQQHSLFDLNIEEEVICKVHEDESVRFFCEPCQTCICVLCTFNDHRDHEVTQFTEAVLKYKAEIERERSQCQGIIAIFEDKLTKVTTVEDIIKRTENEITSLALQLTIEIKNKEKQLLEEIHNMYGDDLLTIIESKSLMELRLSELKNTCNMADVVLQRKDVELLLLKAEIQGKLSEMHSLPDIELPATVSKEVQFISGIMDFGCIQDMDRPLLTKPKNYKEYLENREFPRLETVTVETQTDPAITRPPSSSKSVSTIPVQNVNKAVNTRSRIVQQKIRSNSVQTTNSTLNPIEVQPITCSERKSSLVNSDRLRAQVSEKVKVPDTKDLILTASEILSDYIAKANLDTKIYVDISDD